jgi:hypothetical protein
MLNTSTHACPHAICEALQQNIRCGLVMSTRFTFCSRHSQVRESRKKGGSRSRTCT